MSTPTYDLIETTTLTSAASSVTFSSITQDFRDLVLVVSGKITGATSRNLRITLNSDNVTNYPYVQMIGDGSSPSSSAFSPTELQGGRVGDSSGEATNILQFMDYSATDKHKSILERDASAAQGFVYAYAHRYATTTAISSMQISASSGNWDTGTVISLYGISA